MEREPYAVSWLYKLAWVGINLIEGKLMPFKSKKQQGYLFANKSKLSGKWANTPSKKSENPSKAKKKTAKTPKK